MFTKNLIVQRRRGPRMAPSSPARYAPPAMARAARCGWALKESSTDTNSLSVSCYNCLITLSSHTTASLIHTSVIVLPLEMTHIT